MSFLALRKCLSEPKQLLKLIVLILCIVVALYQLSECFRKIIHPPVSTYYSFKLNESLDYPAVTICRNPGYKTDYFPKYGFTSTNLEYSSIWRQFNYSAYTLSEFFEETTYTMDEIFSIAAFKGVANDYLQVKSLYLLRYGRCFTFTGTEPSSLFSETGGYMFYFSHTDIVKLRNYFGISLSGYHVFIHNPDEILTAEETQEDSFMEYLYLEAGEDLRVNLRVQKYNQLPSNDYQCSTSAEYSKSKCNEECVYKQIVEKTNCTAPWIRLDAIDKPECRDYISVRNLSVYYTQTYRETVLRPCNCHLSCNISVYSTFVQSRKEVTMPQSNLSLYFSSNLITVMEEVFGYDWNVFLSDIGGSLGFLLGLSVIGALGLVEQIILVVFGRAASKKNAVKEDGEDDIKNNCEDMKTVEEKNLKGKENVDVPKIRMNLENGDDNVLVKNSLNFNDYKQNNFDKSPMITDKY